MRPEDSPCHQGSFAEESAPPTSSPCVPRKRTRKGGVEDEQPAKMMQCKKVLGNEQSPEWFLPSVHEINFSGPAHTEEDFEEPMPSTSGLDPGGLRGGERWRVSGSDLITL